MISKHKVKLFCKDDITKIENYDKAINDESKIWHCHHRLELTLDGEFANSIEDLKRLDMYYHRPYFELIFLEPEEHLRLHSKGENNNMHNNGHKISGDKNGRYGKGYIVEGERNGMYGRHHTEESKIKISINKKGQGLGRKHKPESIIKMSEARKEYWRKKHESRLLNDNMV